MNTPLPAMYISGHMWAMVSIDVQLQDGHICTCTCHYHTNHVGKHDTKSDQPDELANTEDL